MGLKYYAAQVESVTEQQPNSLAAHWAVWLTVGNAQLNRWPYLVAKHSGHPGSWHRPRPVSPTWNPSWRTRETVSVSTCSWRLQVFRWHMLKECESYLKMVLVLAKLRMGPRTTSIPLSSDAFSWKMKLVRQQIKELRSLISELLEMSTAGYEAEAFTCHETISLLWSCSVLPTPWSWTLCPCTAAWHRQGWWTFCLFLGGHRIRDGEACPRW